MKIITGSPRSGTSLALSLYYWMETGNELVVGSGCNEPVALTTNVGLRQEEAFHRNLEGLASEFPVIKSPVIGAMLPLIKTTEHEVIVTFRDIRLVAPSVYKHHQGVISIIGQEKPFWMLYSDEPVPDNPFERVVKFWEFLYLSIAEYAGPMSVLNYGFWMEWPQPGGCCWKISDRLDKEISKAIICGMRNGLPYGNSSFDITVWGTFLDTYHLSDAQIIRAVEANERVKAKFAEKGLTCKTWDDYLQERMDNAELLELVGEGIRTAVDCDRLDMLCRMCRRAESMDGNLAEVGVWRGGTSNLMAKMLPHKQLFAFDSFTGLHNASPERGDEMTNGTFDDVSVAEVRSMLAERGNVSLHEGYFPQTADVVENEKFCLVHCDVDTYQSTKDVLDFFWDRMVPGGVIVVDDYGHKHTKGCRQAVDEFCESTKVVPQFYGTIQCFLYKP